MREQAPSPRLVAHDGHRSALTECTARSLRRSTSRQTLNHSLTLFQASSKATALTIRPTGLPTATAYKASAGNICKLPSAATLLSRAACRTDDAVCYIGWQREAVHGAQITCLCPVCPAFPRRHLAHRAQQARYQKLLDNALCMSGHFLALMHYGECRMLHSAIGTPPASVAVGQTVYPT